MNSVFVMNNSEDRIPKEIAADVFALAAQLYAQENQNYSLEELIQAGAEVQIPPELIQQALVQIRAKQNQARERQRKLKLILISGSTGAAIALFAVWAISIFNRGFDYHPDYTIHQFKDKSSNFTPSARSRRNNLQGADSMSANPQDTPQQAQPLPWNHPKPDETISTGEVQQYLLNPEGKVDGLLLNNGLQVKFPHMGDSLVDLVKPGIMVNISGNLGAFTRFGQEVKAKSITNTQTGQTLVEQPPAIPPQPPSSNYSTFSVEGTAQHWLVGHRGEINGVIVSDGAIIKFPPHVGNQLVSTANVGDKIQAQGFGTRNSYGQIIQATTLIVNGQPVSLEPKAITIIRN